MVITPCQGLRSPDVRVGVPLLRRYAGIDIDAADPRYRRPLVRDARALAAALGAEAAWQVVLLGSVASAKYVEPLTEVFGERLVFPAEFVGRGDMSRGGLLLRCVADGRELDYVPTVGARLRGPRPAKLTPRPGIYLGRAGWSADSPARVSPGATVSFATRGWLLAPWRRRRHFLRSRRSQPRAGRTRGC